MVWFGGIINRYLSLDPEMAKKIAEYEGKVIAIDMQGIEKTFYLFPQGEQERENIKVSDHYDSDPDTILRGSPAALFKMGISSDVAPMMLKGEIEIIGDVRLGRDFKKLLTEMDVDWEEHLAARLGDAPAHQLSQLAKQFAHWAGKTKNALAENVSEYLQEESRDVVTGAELEVFYEDVDDLRNDVDRLQARVEALKKQH